MIQLNKIYKQDCLDFLSMLQSNPIIDLTITSPPYNLGKTHHTGNNKFDAYD
jgi:DNA modification methylase